MKVELSENYFKKEFVPFFKKHGYDRFNYRPDANFMCLWTMNNGVKVELKWLKNQKCILIDYQTIKNKPKEKIDEQIERHNVMKEHFKSQGRKILFRKDFGTNANDHGKCFLLEFKNIEDFLLVVKDIENIDGIAKTRRYGTQLYSTEYNPLKIAKGYIFAIENEYQDMLNLHREMLTADNHDKRISLNKKTDILNYREHLVPCIVIHNEAIRLAKEGESAIRISQMIESNLKIGHIRKQDAERLNGSSGLRASMPNGWKFGDSIMARLDKIGIELETE